MEPGPTTRTIPDRCPNPNKGHLSGITPSFTVVAYVPCKSWDCPRCGAIKALQLRQRIEQVTFNRFLTLTHKPHPGETPDQGLQRMRHNWTRLSKRLQRRNRNNRIKYIAVVEWTKKGWPHLHILADMPFLPQRHLSAMWRDLHGSPIVDIRRVKSDDGAARYLSKYLTKGTRMKSKKRRWTASQGYLPPISKWENPNYDEQPKWGYGRNPLQDVLRDAVAHGYDLIQVQPGAYVLIPPRELTRAKPALKQPPRQPPAT